MKANRVEALDYFTFTCVLANLEFPISITFEDTYQTLSRQLKYLIRCCDTIYELIYEIIRSILAGN